MNALLGTVNALLSLVESPARASVAGGPLPRAVVACMGAEQAAYRVALYPPYHAHRDPMPAELADQWERAPRLLQALGWTLASSDQLEADDVMFSFARAEEERGGRALLLSGDRDLFGAVSERVAVIQLQKQDARTEIGPQGVRERYGIDPQLVPDFIALRGDPSDGLPGAPGVGAKTAATLLGAHGSLEASISAARAALEASIPNRACAAAGMAVRIATALREHEAELLDFKSIATLQRIEVSTPADAPTDYAAGAALAGELGMRGLAARLEKLAVARGRT